MNSKWKDVPEKVEKEWYRIFREAAVAEGLNLTELCPICEQATLHQFFDLGRPDARLIKDVLYRGKGSYWAWCSSCFTFEHAQALVPFSWKDPYLHFDRSALTAEPEVLNMALSQNS